MSREFIIQMGDTGDGGILISCSPKDIIKTKYNMSLFLYTLNTNREFEKKTANIIYKDLKKNTACYCYQF